jgi:hypothetical protein
MSMRFFGLYCNLVFVLMMNHQRKIGSYFATCIKQLCVIEMYSLKSGVNPAKLYMYSTPQFTLTHFKCSRFHVDNGYHVEQYTFRI